MWNHTGWIHVPANIKGLASFLHPFAFQMFLLSFFFAEAKNTTGLSAIYVKTFTRQSRLDSKESDISAADGGEGRGGVFDFPPRRGRGR